MPRRYVGGSFDIFDADDDGAAPSATTSLVGSHLQNICIEIESNDHVDVSFTLSPNGARRMIEAINAALAEIATQPVK